MSPRALVRNAADPEQLARADRIAGNAASQKASRLQAVMQTALGRAAMWDLLEAAGVYRSVMHSSGSQVFYNAGRQDFGFELRARLLEADEHACVAMEVEARERLRRANGNTDAAHTAPATGAENWMT